MKTAEPTSMTSVKCPSDPACTPASDEGWMHVSASYNGTVLEIYKNGVLAGRNSFADVDPIPRYLAPLKTYGKFTVGSGWAGQLDEVRVHATALDGDASKGSKQCPARFRNRYGGLGMPEHLNPNTMASVTFNDGGNGGEGAKGIVKASETRRSRRYPRRVLLLYIRPSLLLPAPPPAYGTVAGRVVARRG